MRFFVFLAAGVRKGIERTVAAEKKIRRDRRLQASLKATSFRREVPCSRKISNVRKK